jgi:integrase
VAKVEHHAALPYREIGAFMEKLRKHEGIGAAALEFAILTAARSGEVRGAKWEEINLQRRTWTIPAGRMKAQKEHIVPLSDAAVAVIKAMQESRINDYVFPGAKDDKPLSDMSLTAVLRRMERGDLTAHGFRSTFRDWCAEQTAFPAEMAELALAHTISNKVEAAYRRGNMLLRRFKMMSDWAKWCAKLQPQTGQVLPLRAEARK